MTEDVRVVAEHDSDFYWSVLQDEQLILQMTGLRLSPGVVDLVTGLCDREAQEIFPQAVHALMADVIATAAGNGVQELRLLVWNDAPVIGETCLVEYGFDPAVQLQTWTAPMTTAQQPDELVDHQTLAAAFSVPGASMLTSLVGSCLEESQDLQALSPPDAEALLDNWETLPDAELLLAREGSEFAGLAVLTRDTQVDSRRITTLQYIGVANTFRRRGYASRLLRQALRATGHSEDPEDPGELIAYCDRDNAPAMELYQRMQFTAGEAHTIWVRTLTGPASAGKLY